MVRVPPWWKPVGDVAGWLPVLLALHAVAASATTARAATTEEARGRWFTNIPFRGDDGRSVIRSERPAGRGGSRRDRRAGWPRRSGRRRRASRRARPAGRAG